MMKDGYVFFDNILKLIYGTLNTSTPQSPPVPTKNPPNSKQSETTRILQNQSKPLTLTTKHLTPSEQAIIVHKNVKRKKLNREKKTLL